MTPTLTRRLDLAQRRLRFALSASPLNPRRIPTLAREPFAGKRVIIIGPADTVTDDLQGVDVDGHDVIVRLNSGLFLAERDPARLGSRTDVLFHNLNEEGPRSAGAVPPEVLKRHGVNTVVFPHWSFKGSKSRVYRKRRELEGTGIALNVPSTRFCAQLRQDLTGFQPTVGTSAMAWFLGCDLAELAIHGFTFFSTPYAPSYNDQVRTGAEAMAWAAASEVHNPALEKPLIARLVREAEGRGVTVRLGPNVRPHLT